MFGIGLPEMILILALALIVVGPDKLPELARSLAKGIMELKKTAEGVKEQLKEEANLIDDVRPDLEDAAKTLKSHMLSHPEKGSSSLFGDDDDPDNLARQEAAAAYKEMTQNGVDPAATEPVDLEPESDGITSAPRTPPTHKAQQTAPGADGSTPEPGAEEK